MERKLFCALKKKELAEAVEMAVSDLICRQARGVMIDDGDLSHGANHHHQVRAL
jgi:hypothetical protein